MLLEARVEKLEEQHKQMDENLHSLVKVTAEIKNICMSNQHDIATVRASISALADATHAGFKRADEQHNEFVKESRERFDQLELLIRQSIPSN
ncbi:MAG: hypothetical protein ACR2PX_25065 [Endozoicomonas sp.]|uniref:hypothetical protein n=1 Tax=Endozoicomonas sp. TaxID=1892382 RepID=UPI003D9BBD76